MLPWTHFLPVGIQLFGLLFWSWRWWRHRVAAAVSTLNNQHAYCASCGYDLTGGDIDGFEQVACEACPECGRAIQTEADILIPTRVDPKKSRKTFALMVGIQAFSVVILVGLFLYLPRSRPTSQPSFTTLQQQLLNQSSTTLNQAFTTPSPTHAMYEIDRRLRNGGLSQAERRLLLADVLAYHADLAKPWEWTFGEWIEKGREQGLITDAQWQGYIAQPMPFALECREDIHVGDPLVVRLKVDGQQLRTSMNYRFDLSGVLRDEDAVLSLYDEADTADAAPILSGPVQLRDSPWPDSIQSTLPDGSLVPPGRYRVVVETSFAWPDPKPGVTATAQALQLTGSIEVHPKTERLSFPVLDSPLAEQIQDDLYQEVLKSGGTRIRRFDEAGAYLSVHLCNPVSPIAGSFDLSVDIGGVRSTRSWSYEPATVGNHWREIMFFIPEHLFDHEGELKESFDAFTLWLTPNPEHLKHQIVGGEYLDHTLELRDIPMGLPEP